MYPSCVLPLTLSTTPPPPTTTPTPPHIFSTMSFQPPPTPHDFSTVYLQGDGGATNRGRHHQHLTRPQRKGNTPSLTPLPHPPLLPLTNTPIHPPLLPLTYTLLPSTTSTHALPLSLLTSAHSHTNSPSTSAHPHDTNPPYPNPPLFFAFFACVVLVWFGLLLWSVLS